VATGRRWYLMAWDVDREDWRTFRLDRIRSLTPSTWRFKPREHPDPATYVQRSVSHSPFSHHARVRVHAPLAEVAARTDARWVTLTEVDDSTTLLEASADALEWLAFHVVWLGFDCEILDPPELREVAADLAGRLQRAAVEP
jgi:predicted DNA-binding transcriptional regulator YafY